MLKQVRTKYGICEGVISEGGYALFKGIPYAAPPIGELRWKPPVEPLSWEGVRNCDQWGNAAINSIIFQDPSEGYGKEFYSGLEYPPKMDEDCLYLNIWTPAEHTDEKLPVMMWIHGGGFQNGYGHEIEFDGDGYCKRGVILVTINYRLNIFGYFSHPELGKENPYGASGNYGLLDQIWALRFLKENIAAFGGDPDNITVFGQSAGGGSTQAVCCSPLSKGLIKRAIVQSAGGIPPLLGKRTLQMQEKHGAAFMKHAQCKNIEELRALPAAELFERYSCFQKTVISFQEEMQIGFAVCCDGYALPTAIEDCLLAGQHHDIDYMFGSVTGDNMLGAIKESLCAWAELQEKYQMKLPYLYYFTREMPNPDKDPRVMQGAFHSAELWYMFGTLNRCWRGFSSEDYILSETMLDYWSNFAKKGNPNGSGQITWMPYSKECKMHMQFDITDVGMYKSVL